MNWSPSRTYCGTFIPNPSVNTVRIRFPVQTNGSTIDRPAGNHTVHKHWYVTTITRYVARCREPQEHTIRSRYVDRQKLFTRRTFGLSPCSSAFTWWYSYPRLFCDIIRDAAADPRVRIISLVPIPECLPFGNARDSHIGSAQHDLVGAVEEIHGVS